MNVNDLVENLISFDDEYEWLDFKENWFGKDEIGQYISAVSNGAALCGKEYGYLVWGVKDSDHSIVGTSVSFDKDINNEPYKHYLARNLSPSIPFSVETTFYNGKRIVVVIIPASKAVPTEYRNEAYIRIGSSKEKLNKFPEWKMRLLYTLTNGFPSIVNTAAPDYAQDLTFSKLLVYYASKGIILNNESFEKTLKLRNKDGKYNLMAYILSDNNSIPVRVSVFSGTDKSSALYSVKEFGNTCILYAMDKMLEYGDAINIMQADERNRISERHDVPLFDYEAFHEAILNAFVHNKWLTMNAPQISVFTDRIEILSHGGLAIDQDINNFYRGASIPVNEILASIFLQLRLSERSGRGVPKIINAYGRDAFDISKNSITVTIPFTKINVVGFSISSKVENKLQNKVLNKSREKIMLLMRDNPNITTNQLSVKTDLSIPAINKNIKYLKDNGFITRVGSNKTGYWKVIEK